MATPEEIIKATTTCYASLEDKEGRVIGDYRKWLAIAGNDPASLVFVQLYPINTNQTDNEE